MKFREIIWREQFVDKIIEKHGLYPDEVDEALHSRPLVRRQERGNRPEQDLYLAFGQTDAGRYIVIFFIQKVLDVAMPISARDMTRSERSYYAKRRRP